MTEMPRRLRERRLRRGRRLVAPRHPCPKRIVALGPAASRRGQRRPLRSIRHLARDLDGPIARVVALTADTWRRSCTLARRFRTQTAAVIEDHT